MAAVTQDRAALDLAQLLFDAAFTRQSRDPRSAEYKAGVRSALAWRAHSIPMPRPYAMGTVQADAFYAGVDEGNQLWRLHEDVEKRRRDDQSPVREKY